MKTLQSLKPWTRPDNYIGENWPGYYVFLSQHRDSDCLTRSNFRSGLEAIGGESETVHVVRESHWAVGWVEWIAIHQDDETALELADEIATALHDYPVVDDEDLSSIEHDEAQDVWRNCYNERERIDYIRRHRLQFDFNSLSDMRSCIRGEFFNGHASELIS